MKVDQHDVFGCVCARFLFIHVCVREFQRKLNKAEGVWGLDKVCVCVITTRTPAATAGDARRCMLIIISYLASHQVIGATKDPLPGPLPGHFRMIFSVVLL